MGFEKILYVDLGYYHGDAVEQAFYTSDRVMTIDFHYETRNMGDSWAKEHKGTGRIEDTSIFARRSTAGANGAAASRRRKGRGLPSGKAFVNVPLRKGCGDKLFICTANYTIQKVISSFTPTCVVVQCGTGSVAGDRYKEVSLSSRAIPAVIRGLRDLNVPMLLLGGTSGTNATIAARVWAHCTAAAIGYTDSQLAWDMRVPDHE